jgi:hypothetical protein
VTVLTTNFIDSTDKQWLQENLLCLFSNAVKYTLEGDVTVRVTLYIHQEPIISKIDNENNSIQEDNNSSPVVRGGEKKNSSHQLLDNDTSHLRDNSLMGK